MAVYLFELASDNFTRPNESPLESPPWNLNGNPFPLQVVSDVCKDVSAYGGENYTGVSLPDDQYCSGTLPNVESWEYASLRLAVRASGASDAEGESFSDGYYLVVDGGQTFFELFVLTNGSFTVLGAGDFDTSTNGDVWTLAVTGTTLYVLQNGTTLYSTTNTTYASGVTALALLDNIDPTGTAQCSLFATGLASTNPAIATSTFNPTAGAVATRTAVTVSNVDSVLSGFAMYYTTDGSTPTTGSTLYTGAITVSEAETIKVLAGATGYTNSAIASAAYTIRTAAPMISEMGTARFHSRITRGEIVSPGGDGQTH